MTAGRSLQPVRDCSFEAPAAPDSLAVAPSEPVAVEKTGPDMLDRLSDLFSFGSKDAETAPGLFALPRSS